jgi:hypothetical protein
VSGTVLSLLLAGVLAASAARWERCLLSRATARMSPDWREHPELSSGYDEIANGAAVQWLPRDPQTWAVLGFYVAVGYWLFSTDFPAAGLWLVAAGIGIAWASLWVERNEASLGEMARQHGLSKRVGGGLRRYWRLWLAMFAMQSGVAAVGLFAGATVAAFVT